jgi:phospholipase/carboxylesterase
LFNSGQEPGGLQPLLLGAARDIVSHGTRDGVLPIDRCSRRIVPDLERGGCEVGYREFDGGHTIPPEAALEAVGWFTH